MSTKSTNQEKAIAVSQYLKEKGFNPSIAYVYPDTSIITITGFNGDVEELYKEVETVVPGYTGYIKPKN